MESMANGTQIEWTDATWNPVTGCTKITAGCDNCYAERFSERFRGVPDHPFENGFGARFANVAAAIMETYMLRETNVKDLVVQLARDGKLDDTWGGGRHKPAENTVIRPRNPSG
jgi:hypothetical protein